MGNSSLLVGFGTSLLVILAIKLLKAWKNARLHPLPPGPKGVPLVGNIWDLPPPGTFVAHHWIKHKELYGPISCVNVLGSTLILINDPQIAFDLLEKQSVVFSERPQLTFMRMVGWEGATGGLPNNETLRTHRKHFARIIGTKAAASQFDKLQEAEVAHFLLQVLDAPQKLEIHIQKEVGSVILQMVYGYNTEQFKEDPLLVKITRVMDDFARSAVPGTYMVDTIPILRFVPSWFPGAGWKKVNKRMAKDLKEAFGRPYAFVEHQMAQGKSGFSYLSRLIETSKSAPEDKDINKWTAASLYGGGSDTTVAAISAFFLAMTVFPEVQKKAQEEIDRVVGSQRLPTLDDRDSLPYVDAVVKEALRWHSVGPMGIPHSSAEDANYRGYRIPKKAILIPNIWWFTHDPAVYKDPMVFRPERHMEGQDREPEPDPRKLAFGFGRRICPGKILAETSMFLTFAQSLAVFDIAKKVVDGKVMEPKIEFLPGVISHPAPFETSIKPRSQQHEKLIRSLEQTFPWKESDARVLGRMEI